MGNEHPFVQPYEQFPCKDGFVFFGGYTDKFWRISCAMFGEPEVADDPAIDTMAKRFDPDDLRAKVKPIVPRWFADRTKAELEAIAGDQVPLSAVKTIAEVVDDPQIAARDMIVDVEYPRYGPLRMVGLSDQAERDPGPAARHGARRRRAHRRRAARARLEDPTGSPSSRENGVDLTWRHRLRASATASRPSASTVPRSSTR